MSARLRFATAQELFDAFPTALEDIGAAPSDRPSLDYLRDLVSSPTPEDAITFCAYLLPRRAAVWWGHQCLSHLPDLLTPQDHELLQVVEGWVREPEEDQRYAALDAGMAAPAKTPGAWLALGAGWSGGSMAPPGMAPVPPPPFLTARAVNAGVLGGLARVAIKQRAAILSACVTMGVRLTES
jgi:hypothetical protein